VWNRLLCIRGKPLEDFEFFKILNRHDVPRSLVLGLALTTSFAPPFKNRVARAKENSAPLPPQNIIAIQLALTIVLKLALFFRLFP